MRNLDIVGKVITTFFEKKIAHGNLSRILKTIVLMQTLLQ